MRKGTCIHYNGMIQHDCCDAGVNYKLTFGNQPGILRRMPCIQYQIVPAHGRGTHIRPGDEVVRKEIDRLGQEMVQCILFEEPTDEQVADYNKAQDKALANTLAAIQVVSTWQVKPKPQEDRREVVACPACGGNLHLRQSAFNGHCSTKCETDGCVQFME